MDNTNIYALLVGINTYPSPVPQLEGCVNDMYAMKRFLLKRIPLQNLHIEVLKDQAATRMNIVEKFESHLTKARKNDTVLFYYSGHGSQEPAHEIFWDLEPDKKNETLVCYDSRFPDGMDLADKELATLIELVGQNGAHVCVILDCCHSGSGTRSLINDPPGLFWPKTTSGSGQHRSLDSYILPRTRSLDRSAQVSSFVDSFIPQPRHVALYGAQPHELAKEIIVNGKKRGVFTYSLLEVLQYSKGYVSYRDVIRRVHSLVTQRTFDQSPQLYTQVQADLLKPFLGRELPESGEHFQLSYSGTKGWIIDGGLSQGLKSPSHETDATLLGIYPETENASQGSPRLGQVAISQVHSEESTVVIKGALDLSPTKTYQARIERIPSDRFGICIRGDSAEGKLLAQQALSKVGAQALIQEASIREISDFNLIAKLDMRKYTRKPGFSALPGYVITRSSDRDDQAMVEYIEGFGGQEAEKAIEYLNKIAYWKKVSELYNPGARIPSEVAKIDLFHAEENEAIQGGDKNFTFSYFNAETPEDLPQFRLQISHTYSQKLYCVFVYLSSQFGIQTQLLGESGMWLEPGEKVWAMGGQAFTAKVSDRNLAWGNRQIQERFKVIVATQQFDVQHFNQLGIQDINENSRSAEFDLTPPVLKMVEEEYPEEFDWTTNELTLTIIRRD
ncbi:MAG: caspase family protein [Bacteroidota bacterium]